MSDFDRRALFQALQNDAARMGITVQELIKRITSGAQVIGAGQDREMIDPPTYMSTGEGHMPQIHNRLESEEEDDFSDLVQERERALVEAGGDDLAREAIFVERNRARANEVSPFQNVNPPSATGTKLSGDAIVNPGDNPVEIGRWTGSDFEATNVTCTLGQAVVAANVDGGLNQHRQARPFAVVRWGVGGIACRAEVDIGTGTQFMVGASSVSLSVAEDPLTNPSAETAVAVPLRLSGALSFRDIRGTESAPLTRTLYSDTAVDTAAPQFTVPAFAKGLMVFRSGIAEIMTIAFCDVNLSPIYSVVVAANTNMADFVPLSGDITTIIVTMSGGASTKFLRLVFSLAL